MVNCYLGEIRLFGGNYAPVGWEFCLGQLMSIQQYSALYSLIGTSYGGDGRTSFALPDMCGRIVVGAGHGPGLSMRQLGDTYGVETVSLIEEQMPSHRHGMRASTLTGTAQSPEGNILAAPPAGGAFYLPDDSSGLIPQLMYANAVDESGRAVGHPNMMPWTGLYYIIAMDGNYPTPA